MERSLSFLGVFAVRVHIHHPMLIYCLKGGSISKWSVLEVAEDLDGAGIRIC